MSSEAGGGALLAFSRQVGWTFAARVVAALLQLLIVGFLARELQPHEFAQAMAVLSVGMLITALNGFGLNRQMFLHRAVDPHDAGLPRLFAHRLNLAWLSGIAWLAAALVLRLATGDDFFLAAGVLAVWLVAEQVTQVWNGLAIVDGRAHRQLVSHLLRRVPPAAIILVVAALDADVMWAWTAGLALGGCAAVAAGIRGEERWARTLLPRRVSRLRREDLVWPYWWTMVGMELRELTVPTLMLVGPSVAAVFALPARLIYPMQMVTLATASAAFPRFARMQSLSLRRLAAIMAAGSAPTVVTAGVVFLAAPVVPQLVGDAYEGSAAVLQVLAVAAALAAPTPMLRSFLQAREGRPLRAAGRISMGTSLLQLAAAGTGALLAGAIGAAVGVLLAQVLETVLMASAVVGAREAPAPARAQELQPL